MMFRLAFVAALAAGFAAENGAPRAAEYMEAFEADKAPEAVMAGTLLLGRDDAWEGELRDGAYHLTNSGKAGAVRYFHLRQRQTEAPEIVTISVDVEGRFDGPAAGAGLLYDYDPQSQSYFAFLLGQDGRYAVWRREAEGFQRVATGSHDAIRPDGINLLSARLAGTKAELAINGAPIGVHPAEGARDSAVGIIAFDTGAYRFDNFRYAVE